MEGLYGDEWEEHLKHENMPREDYQVIGNFFFQIYYLVHLIQTINTNLEFLFT